MQLLCLSNKKAGNIKHFDVSYKKRTSTQSIGIPQTALKVKDSNCTYILV